jgi:hypothetical protein
MSSIKPQEISFIFDARTSIDAVANGLTDNIDGIPASGR